MGPSLPHKSASGEDVLTASKSRVPGVVAACFIGIAVVSPARTQETRSTLAQQKMCAEQADKFFHDLVSPGAPRKPIDSLVASYVDHYDMKAKARYVAITRNQPSGKDFIYSTTVFDAFEGTGYATYIQTSDRVIAGSPVKPPLWCSIEPRGQQRVTCKSAEDFDRLVEKYFGVVVR
jgi:hypothetical protein